MLRVIIFGVPRSGTSWLGQILNSSPSVEYRYQPLHSYSYEPKLAVDASASDVESFFEALVKSDEPYINQLPGARVSDAIPTFDKEPEPLVACFKEVHDFDPIVNAINVDAGSRLIALIRDPVEVLKSWINAPREFNREWDADSEYYSATLKNSEYEGNHYGLAQWISTTKTVLELQARIPNRVLTVSYRKLTDNPLAETERIFDFLALPVTQQTTDFLVDSRTRNDGDPYGVFRSGTSTKTSGSSFQYSPQTLDQIRQQVIASGLQEFLNPRES